MFLFFNLYFVFILLSCKNDSPCEIVTRANLTLSAKLSWYNFDLNENGSVLHVGTFLYDGFFARPSFYPNRTLLQSITFSNCRPWPVKKTNVLNVFHTIIKLNNRFIYYVFYKVCKKYFTFNIFYQKNHLNSLFYR